MAVLSDDFNTIRHWIDQYHTASESAAKLDEAYYVTIPNEIKKLKDDLTALEKVVPPNPADIASAKADIAAAEARRDQTWKDLQDLKNKNRDLKDSIRESLFALNAKGKSDFLSLQPVERENITKEEDQGKVVAQDGYDKYYRDAVLNGAMDARSPLVTGGGGYSFISGKGELASMKAPMSAKDAILKFDLFGYNSYYRDIPDPANPGKTKKWEKDLVGVTWKLADGEMRKVRVATDGKLIELIRDLPKTKAHAAEVLGKTGIEATDFDANWLPVTDPDKHGMTSGGGREWLFDAASATKLNRAHQFQTFFYPAAPPDDPGSAGVAADMGAETAANKLKVEKTEKLVRDWPHSLTESAQLLKDMTDAKMNLLPSSKERTDFARVRLELKGFRDDAVKTADDLKALLNLKPIPNAHQYGVDLDAAIAAHEAKLRIVEAGMQAARDMLAAVPTAGAPTVPGAVGAPGAPGAPAAAAGAWAKDIDGLRTLIQQYKDSYGRTKPGGWDLAMATWNDWLKKQEPDPTRPGTVRNVIPDSVRTDITAKINDLNKYFDASTTCSNVRSLADEYEKTGKLPGGWVEAKSRFEVSCRGGYVPPTDVKAVGDRITAAEAAAKAKGGDATAIFAHSSRFVVDGKTVRVKATGAIVGVVATAAEGRRVVETSDPAKETPGVEAALKDTTVGIDVHVGHGSALAVGAKTSAPDGGTAVKDATVIGAGGSSGAKDKATDEFRRVVTSMRFLAIDHFHGDHFNYLESILYAPADNRLATPNKTLKAEEYAYYKKIETFILPNVVNIPATLLTWVDKLVVQAESLGASTVRLARLDPNPSAELEKEGKFSGQTVTTASGTIFAFHDDVALAKYKEARDAMLPHVGDFDDLTALAAGGWKYTTGSSKYVRQYEPGGPAGKEPLYPVGPAGDPLPGAHKQDKNKKEYAWVELASGDKYRAVSDPAHQAYVDANQTSLGKARRLAYPVPKESPLEGLNATATAYVDIRDGVAWITAHDQPAPSLDRIADSIEATGLLKGPPKPSAVIWKGAHHGGKLYVDSEAAAVSFERWCAFLARNSSSLDGPTIAVTCKKAAWEKGTIFALNTHGYAVHVTDADTGTTVIEVKDGTTKSWKLADGKDVPAKGPVPVPEWLTKFRAYLVAFSDWQGSIKDLLPAADQAGALKLWDDFSKLNKRICDAVGLESEFLKPEGASTDAKAIQTGAIDCNTRYEALRKTYGPVIDAGVAASKPTMFVPSTVFTVTPEAKLKIGDEVRPVIRAKASTAASDRSVPVLAIGPAGTAVPAGLSEMIAKKTVALPASFSDADLAKAPDLKAKFEETSKKLESGEKTPDEKKAASENAKLVADYEAYFKPWSENASKVPNHPNSTLGLFDSDVSKVIPAADAARLKGYLKLAAQLTVNALTAGLQAEIGGHKDAVNNLVLMGYNALRFEGYITESQARDLAELMYRAGCVKVNGYDPGAAEAKKHVAASELKADLEYFEKMGEATGGPVTGPVDINSATAFQLCGALHISASLAENIVATRKAIGGFKAPEDLIKVKGMDDPTLKRIMPSVKVGAPKADDKAPVAPGTPPPEPKKTLGDSIKDKYDAGKKMMGDAAKKTAEFADKAKKHAEKKHAQFDAIAELFGKYKAFFSGLPGAKELPVAELAQGLKELGSATFGTFLATVDPEEYPELAALIGGLKPRAAAISAAIDLAVSIHELYTGFMTLGESPDITKLISVLKTSQHLLGDLDAAVAAFKEWKVWGKLPAGLRDKLEGKGAADLSANLAGIIKVLEFVDAFKTLLEDFSSGKLKQMPAGDIFARFAQVGSAGFDALAGAMDTPAMKQFLEKRPQLAEALRKILPFRKQMVTTLELGTAIFDVYPKIKTFLDDIEHDRISSPMELASRVMDLGSAIIGKFDVLLRALDAFGLMTPKVQKIAERAEQVMGTVKAVLGFVALFDKYKTFFEGMVGGKPGSGIVWPALEEFMTLIDETQKAVEAVFADKLLQDYVFKKYPQIEGIYNKIAAKKAVFISSLGEAKNVLALYKSYEDLYNRIEKAGISDIAPIFFDTLSLAADTIDRLNASLDLVEQWGIKLPPSVKSIARTLTDKRLQEALKQMRVVIGVMHKYQGMFQGKTVPMEIKDVIRDVLTAAEAGIRGFAAIMQYPAVQGYFGKAPAPVQKAIKFVTEDPGLKLIDLLVRVLDTVQEAENLYNDLFNSDKFMDFGTMAQRLGHLLEMGVGTFDDAIKIAEKYEDRLPKPMRKVLDKLKKFSIVRLIHIGDMVGETVNKIRDFADGVSTGKLGWIKTIMEFGKMVPGLLVDAVKIGKEVALFLKDIGVASPKMWARIMKIPGVKKVAEIFKKVASATKGSGLIKKLLGIGKALHIDKIAMVLLSQIDTIEAFMEGGMTIEQAIGMAIEKAIKNMILAAGSFIGGLAGRAIGTTAGSAAGSVIPFLGTAIGGWVGGWLGDLLGSYLGETLAEKIWDAFIGDGTIGNAAGGLFSNIRQAVKDFLPDWLFFIVDTVVEKIKGFLDAVLGFVKRALGLIVDIIDNIADIGTMIMNAVMRFLEIVKGWLKPIGDWIKEMWEKYNPIEIAKRAAGAVWDGISSVGSAIGDFFGFSEKGAMEGSGHAVGITAMMGRMANLVTYPGLSKSFITEEYGEKAPGLNYLGLVSFKEGAPSEDRMVEDAQGKALRVGVGSSEKFYRMTDPRPRGAHATGDDTGDAVEYVYVAWDAPGSSAPGTALIYGYIKKQNLTMWPKPTSKFAQGPMSWWAGKMMSMIDHKPDPVRAKSKDGGMGDEGSAFGVDRLPSGTPLNPGLQSEMSNVLGATGLGDVRIHTGSMAAGVTSKFNADAVTIGKDIFFGAGKYDSTSPEGKALIGHELTHVLQDPAAGSHHDHEAEALGTEGKLRSYFRETAGMTHMKDGGPRHAGGTTKPHAAATKRQITPTQGSGPAFDAELKDRILQNVLRLAEKERFEGRERYGLWR
ncbi:MAG TPA: DUF4157 domain-containing protein [Myxococcota bacterium]|jgi:DNA uptake protein ComE-like DNA-binding protein|nr:DUF4157 domain-containing protein [Myxococcota bacterium]